MKKILLIGEYYSSNFGDGIIVDSSKHILEKLYPYQDFHIIDFSGRSNYPIVSNKNIKNTNIFRKLNSLRNKIFFLPELMNISKRLLNKNYLDYMNRQLKGADYLIFSGGHILMDNALEFPLRLLIIKRITKKNGTKIIFNSCGSEKPKRFLGKMILRNVLKDSNVKVISVRDNLHNIYNIVGTKNLNEKYLVESDDPAVLISKAYGINKNESSQTIGLGVISHFAYLSASRRLTDKYLLTEKELYSKWVEIIENLLNEGLNVKIFSNGGYHDTAMANRLKQQFGNRIDIEIPRTPQELVSIISSCKAIFAHRLHANIVAYSLKIPSIGFVWDDKLNEFGKKTERGKYFINIKNHSTDEILNLLNEAIEDGIDYSVYENIERKLFTDLSEKINFSKDKE